MKYKKYIILIYIYIYIVFLVLFGTASAVVSSHKDINGITAETITICEGTSVLQTFFPLSSDVTSIELTSSVAATGTVKIFSNDDGTVYFNGQVNFNKGKNVIQLNQPLISSLNHEFYIEITALNGSIELCKGNQDSKDNHLIIDGIEETYDIALAVNSKPSFPLGVPLLVLTIMLILVMVIPGFRPRAKDREANLIDVYRSLSALSILGVHCSSAYLSNPVIKSMWTAASGIGIVMFGAVSGLLVWKSYEKYSCARQFWVHRFKAIYPTYIIMIGLMYVYFKITGVQLPEDSSNLYWLRYIFCLNTIVPTTENIWVNLCATWMIPAFMLFYILVPILKKVITSFKRSIICLVVLYFFNFIFYQTGMRLLQGTKIDFGIISSNPLFLQDLFLLGIITYFAKKENKTNELILLCALCGVFGMIIPESPAPLIPCGAVTLLLFISDKFSISKCRIFLDLNEISFPLYMFHSVLLVVLAGPISALSYSGLQFLFIFIYSIFFALVMKCIISAPSRFFAVQSGR